MKKLFRVFVLMGVLPILITECIFKGLKDGWKGLSIFYRLKSNFKKWADIFKES